MKKFLLTSTFLIISSLPVKSDIIGPFPPRVLQLAAFTTAGTFEWKVPANTTVIYPYGCGGGGGGGFGVLGVDIAGGGGGGAAKCIQPYAVGLPVTPGQTLQIFIGTAGAGGILPATAATDGGNTDILGASTPAGYTSNFPRLYGGLHGGTGIDDDPPQGGTGGNGGGITLGGQGKSTGESGGLSAIYGGVSGGGGGAGGGGQSTAQGLVGGSSLLFESANNSSGTAAGGGPGGSSIFGLGGTGPLSGNVGLAPAPGSCGAAGAGGGSNANGGPGIAGCIFILY